MDTVGGFNSPNSTQPQSLIQQNLLQRENLANKTGSPFVAMQANSNN